MTIRVYVAGPMTGYPDLNFPAFHAAARDLRQRGFVVLNPAEINADHDAEFQQRVAEVTCQESRRRMERDHWRACMRRDLAALVTCYGIAMLPGWERSRGATLEHHNATQLGLVVESLAWWVTSDATVFALAA